MTALALAPPARPPAIARSAAHKVALGLVDEHARHCVIGGKKGEQEKRTAGLMGAISRLVRRS